MEGHICCYYWKLDLPVNHIRVIDLCDFTPHLSLSLSDCSLKGGSRSISKQSMISRLIPWWVHADLCQTKLLEKKNLNWRSWNQAGAPPIVLGAHHHLSSERSGFTTVCAFMLDYIRMSDISLGRINKCQIHSLQPESLPWMTGGSRVCIYAAINSCLWIMQS